MCSCPVFPAPFMEDAVFAPLYILASFVKNKLPIDAWFISGLSIWFHGSMFLFLCQYHTILMTVALKYNLKSGRLVPPAPFFFLKTVLVLQGLLCLHMNCEFFCSSSVKNAIGNLIGVTLNLWIAFGSIIIFTILSSYPGTWTISPSVYVIFDFLLQCLIIFCVQFFCLLQFSRSVVSDSL